MNCITFFAGAGGLDMGLHKAGFDMKMSLEIVEKYCETLKTNHPDWNVIKGDIMDFDKDKVLNLVDVKDGEIDLIASGSPCQSFSTSGLRKSFSDPRGKAMIKYVELIEELQPKVFLLENVKGLLSAALEHRKIEDRGKDKEPLKEEEKPGSALNYLLSKIQSYNIEMQVLNSANYGVAQKRERVFLVGVRKDIKEKFTFPEPTHCKDSVGLLPWRTVGDVLEKLKGKVEKHTYVTYSPARLKYMKMIPKGGGNWRSLPEEVAIDAMGGAYKSGGGKVGFFRRVKVYEPSPTLLTSPHQKSTNLGHPFEDRPLSIEEYLEIQGFPNNYVLKGSLLDQYTQVGNAVPVELAYKIGLQIYKFLEHLKE